jgi:hypothetical protein
MPARSYSTTAVCHSLYVLANSQLTSSVPIAPVLAKLAIMNQEQKEEISQREYGKSYDQVGDPGLHWPLLLLESAMQPRLFVIPPSASYDLAIDLIACCWTFCMLSHVSFSTPIPRHAAAAHKQLHHQNQRNFETPCGPSMLCAYLTSQSTHSRQHFTPIFLLCCSNPTFDSNAAPSSPTRAPPTAEHQRAARRGRILPPRPDGQRGLPGDVQDGVLRQGGARVGQAGRVMRRGAAGLLLRRSW